jgi:predicted RND superfamily exporter protein
MTEKTAAVIRFVSLLAAMVRRAPAIVLVVVLVLTGGFMLLSQDVQQGTGNEGFAPENAELLAAETLGERFGDTSEEVMQVLVRGDDVISADGLAAVQAVTEAIESSDQADLLSSTPERPAIVSYLSPVQMALAGPLAGAPLPEGELPEGMEPPAEGELPEGMEPPAEGELPEGVEPPAAGESDEGEGELPAIPAGAIPPGALDDDALDALYLQALESTPPEQAQFLSGLLPDDADVESASSDVGMVLVFLNMSSLEDPNDFDQVIEAEAGIAEAVDNADLPGGMSAEAFSFSLLFSDMDSFEQEVSRLFAMAFGLIVLILAGVFWLKPRAALSRLGAGRRTLADVLLTMATIVMAILWMMGSAALLGPGYLDVIGPMSEMTQILPVLLIGLGVDYAIHLTSRYREDVAGGATVEEGITAAVHTVGVALTLATMTTAVGFLTNVVNPVPALRDFGILAAVGIAAAFILMLTFVPAARLVLDRRAQRHDRLPREAFDSTSERILPGIMARTAVLAERVPVVTLLVTVVLGGGLGAYGLSQLETRFSSTDFVPEGSPIVATFDEIVARFGGGFGEQTQVLVSGEVATPETHNALVEAHRNLVDVPDVSTFGEQAQAESPVTVLGQMLAPSTDGTPSELAPTAAELGVQPDLTVAPEADVAALYAAMDEAAPEATSRVVAFDSSGEPELLRVSIQTTAGEDGAGELRENLDDAFAPVEDAGAEVVATSNPIINDVIITALQESQVSSLAITLLAALVLLVIAFWIQHRRPLLGVITIAPVALVVLWTFGMMAATGIPFGPVTATIAALAIGIGVPYTIHITHRYQEDRRRIADPAEAIRSTVRHTGGALAGSAFTTITGFGILVTSSLTPFRQFGLVTAYAIGFALLAAAIVLPSMLALWDRYHRRRGDADIATAPPAEPSGEEVARARV